ncbi:MAG: RES family NAD+ phosphorylase [Acidobacteria bacterium]|nr:RES family NAD+ phosphorylase [Acidobacteriota bacterium]
MKPTLEQCIKNALSLATSFKGVCFRVLSQRFATQKDALSAKGSIIKGGRFNFKGNFGVLYLSCDSHTCLEESTRTSQKRAITVANELPKTVVGIEVKLSKVLDLTDAKMRRRLGIKYSDLTKTDWEKIQNNGQEAITQVIGRLAGQSGFEALLVPSSVWRGKNLDIFIDRLRKTSKLTLINSQAFPKRRR